MSSDRNLKSPALPFASRRDFLFTASAAAACAAVGGTSRHAFADAPVPTAVGTASADTVTVKPAGIAERLGIVSYSLRKFDLQKALAVTKQLGLKNLCLKTDFHLKMSDSAEKTDESLKMIKDSGLNLYSIGVVYMKSPEEVEKSFEFAKRCGLKMITAAPNVPLLPVIDKLVKQYDIELTVHNHGPDNPLFPTPESALREIKDLDSRIGICLDIGHTTRAGEDLLAAVKTCFGRLRDMHIKDVTAATKQGKTVSMGHGIINLPALFRTLTELKYAGFISLEYDAEDKEPLPAIFESIGYARGSLVTI